MEIPQEQIIKRLDSLPQKIEDFGLSDFVRDKINEISQKNGFSEYENFELHKIVGFVLTAFLHRGHLGEEIQKMLEIEPAMAEGVAREISLEIISPIKNDLDLFYEEVNRPSSPVSVQSPEKIDKNIPVKSAQSNPFVIHQQEFGPQEGSEDGGSDLVRPSFYTPPVDASREGGDDDAPPARLELGTLGAESSSAGTIKVGDEHASVVHYSAPETNADPFAADLKRAYSSPVPEKISPDNVVNLKDIPQ